MEDINKSTAKKNMPFNELQEYLATLSYEERAIRFPSKSLKERLEECSCDVKQYF